MRLTRALHEDFVNTIPTRPQGLQCPPCTGRCNQGRDCPANACAIEGGEHRDPVDSKTHRDRGLIVGALLVLCGWPAAAVLVSVCYAAAMILSR